MHMHVQRHVGCLLLTEKAFKLIIMFLLVSRGLCSCSLTRKTPNNVHTCLSVGMLSAKSTAFIDIEVLVLD